MKESRGGRAGERGHISNAQPCYTGPSLALRVDTELLSGEFPQNLFCFTSLQLGGKRGICLKFHVIHARIICYSMKVLFTRKSIRGSISLVPSSPSAGARAPGRPGRGGKAPSTQMLSLLGAQHVGGLWEPRWRLASCGHRCLILMCSSLGLICGLCLYGAHWNQHIYFTWDFFSFSIYLKEFSML